MIAVNGEHWDGNVVVRILVIYHRKPEE